MKKIFLSVGVALALVGCGETKLNKEDIVCEYDKLDPLWADIGIPAADSIFTCTNKAGELVSGMIELDESGKSWPKDKKRLYIKDGFPTKYENDYYDTVKDQKYELLFENGKAVSFTWSGMGRRINGQEVASYLGKMTSGKPTKKQ